jgi:hypothetical protein
MSKQNKKEIVGSLLSKFGKTFGEELGINLSRNTPSPLFRWLCTSMLLSARISSDIAMDAARGLFAADWGTARKLADSTWRKRVKVLNQAGYTRYQERTATMLGDVANATLERYGGDLRELQAEAECDPARERSLLKQFKGMGDVGVDIFFREAQGPWPELAPFADRRAIAAAKQLGLGIGLEIAKPSRGG